MRPFSYGRNGHNPTDQHRAWGGSLSMNEAMQISNQETSLYFGYLQFHKLPAAKRYVQLQDYLLQGRKILLCFSENRRGILVWKKLLLNSLSKLWCRHDGGPECCRYKVWKIPALWLWRIMPIIRVTAATSAYFDARCAGHTTFCLPESDWANYATDCSPKVISWSGIRRY